MRNQSYILVARGFSAVLLCLFAALMVCGLSAVAEVPGSGLDDCIELPDNESQAAVGRAENWAKSLTTFEAKFIQESSAAALGASEQSGGELAFANPGRMRRFFCVRSCSGTAIRRNRGRRSGRLSRCSAGLGRVFAWTSIAVPA